MPFKSKAIPQDLGGHNIQAPSLSVVFLIPFQTNKEYKKCSIVILVVRSVPSFSFKPIKNNKNIGSLCSIELLNVQECDATEAL